MKKVVEAQGIGGGAAGAAAAATGAAASGAVNTVKNTINKIINNPIVDQVKADPKTGDLKAEEKTKNLMEVGFDINAALANLANLGIPEPDAKAIFDDAQTNRLGLPSTIYRYLSEVAKLIMQANANPASGIALARHLLIKFPLNTDMALDVYGTIAKYAGENPSIGLIDMAAKAASDPSYPYITDLMKFATFTSENWLHVKIPGDLMAAFATMAQPNNPVLQKTYLNAKNLQLVQRQQEMLQIKFDEAIRNIKYVANQKAAERIKKITEWFDEYEHNPTFIKSVMFGLMWGEVASAISGATIGQGKMELRRENVKTPKGSADKPKQVLAAQNPQSNLQILPGMQSQVQGLAGGQPLPPSTPPQMGSNVVGQQAAQQGTVLNQQLGATTNLYGLQASVTPDTWVKFVQPYQVQSTKLDFLIGPKGAIPIQIESCKQLMGKENLSGDQEISIFESQSMGQGTPEQLAEAGKYLSDLIAQAWKLFNDVSKTLEYVTKSPLPPNDAAQLREPLEAFLAQKNKSERDIVGFEQMAVMFDAVAPILREINLLSFKKTNLDKAISRFGGGGANGLLQATTWPLVWQKIGLLNQIAGLYMKCINSIDDKMQSNKKPYLQQFLYQQKSNFYLHGQELQREALDLEMSTMFQHIPGVTPQALMGAGGGASGGGGGLRGSSLNNINLIKLAETEEVKEKSEIFSEDEDDTNKDDDKETTADAKMQNYWDNLLPGYGTVLEHPQKNRFKRIKYKFKKSM
jgi:hypothetical protein